MLSVTQTILLTGFILNKHSLEPYELVPSGDCLKT
jgi:hypothetical protein